MRLSMRDQLTGTIESVTKGEAMAVVRITLTGGQTITSAITADAADDLGLAPGMPVTALVKATEVALGID